MQGQRRRRALIEAAVDRAFAAGLRPCELGGADGTDAIAAAVLRELQLPQALGTEACPV